MLILLCIQGVAQTSGIWIGRTEIAALPTSGPAWDNLKAKADQSCGAVDLSNQDQSNNVCIMAKALVFARTGQSSYRTDTVAALQSIVNMGTYNGRALALGRELGAYVISADLIDLRNYNPSLDSQFRAKIKSLLTTTTSGGPSNIIDCHEDRPNNWGAHCGGARAAVDAYLGDQQDLARVAQVFKGWLGDRSSYAGFTYGDLSWQCDSSRPVGINPTGCTKSGHPIDGVLPDDQRRSGGFTWPAPQENYVYEALQGALMQAVILKRAGYDAFAWENRALLRAFQWLHTEDDFPTTGDDDWEPFLINCFYGTSFPARAGTTPGKNVGWTDWTHPGTYAPPPAGDNTPPTISGVTASLVTNTSATVMWSTNEASDGTIEYGRSTSYGSSSNCSAAFAISHSGTVSGLATGTEYHFRVKSKDAVGNLATSGDGIFKTSGSTQPSPRATAVALTTDRITPQNQGAVVTFTAAATGGSGSYEYTYYLWNPANNTWSVARAYSGNANWTWNTAGMGPGTYEIQVWARNSGSTAAYEAYKGVCYTIMSSTLRPPTGVALTTDRITPQYRGAVITFTAAATGGSGPYEYMYYLWSPTANSWSVARAYSSSPIWTWNTASTGSGTYEIQVWTRTSGSTAPYQAYRSVRYTLTQ